MTTEKIKYSIECLKLVTDEFDKNDIPYWLEYGTLLGAYRGSTLISYDYDMDIGVEIKYSDKIKSILENMILENKFEKLPFAKWIDNKIYQIKFKNQGEIEPLWLDVYFFDRVDNYLYSNFFTKDQSYKCKTNISQIEKLESIRLGDFYFKCPTDVTKFLKIRFGDDFMIPQSRCNFLNKEWWEIDDNVGKQYLD
jgi:phosphorylcholine metabolism protein LicD